MAERTVSLAELVDENQIEVGAGRPRSVSQELPILRVADVLDGKIGSPDFSPSLESYDSGDHGPKVSRPGDIVLTVKGTVGRVALIPGEAPRYAYSPQLCYFRPRADGPLMARYLYYWFRSADFWTQANALKGQTDMADFISLGDIFSLKLRVPSRSQQEDVVSVLGGLDDKIAVNECIAAKSLDLADAQFYRASRGLEFSAETFGSVAAVVGGGTPSTKVEDYWGGGIAWTTPSDVTALSSPYLFETGRTITAAGLDNCASQLYPAHSIFMTSRATIGAFALPQIPAAVNQGFIVVLPPSDEMRWWLLHEMRSRVDEMISLANGSTFLELSRKNFKAMSIRLPSGESLIKFARIAAPLHQRAAQASAEIRALSALRDTLLPQLMSGKLRVRDVERSVEDAV
ncbi:restriction endonuclease subunit S [Streptomyces huasconensis]|uniref:restriction endonuclease subunit S n=1 Tax=Streptomyces huasconensis TaxID=1854574 RepID=UPI0033D5EAF4